MLLCTLPIKFHFSSYHGEWRTGIRSSFLVSIHVILHHFWKFMFFFCYISLQILQILWNDLKFMFSRANRASKTSTRTEILMLINQYAYYWKPNQTTIWICTKHLNRTKKNDLNEKSKKKKKEIDKHHETIITIIIK